MVIAKYPPPVIARSSMDQRAGRRSNLLRSFSNDAIINYSTMNYQQTVDYLYQHLPMFTRVGAVALKHDLCNTLELCKLLDNPQDKFKSVT